MTISAFKRLYREYQESGLSIKDFCSNQGFAPSTFYYWKKQFSAELQHEPEHFVPLVFDSSLPVAGSRPVPAAVNSPAPIEFVFPNGTRMVIRDKVDMHLLKAIVHLLD
jgi:hypothetical protein